VSICIPHASSDLQGADADITYISPISPLHLTYIFPTSSLYLQSADAAKVCGYKYLLGERSATHQLLQLDRTYAAALGSCSPMRWRLQPYVMEAATLCDGGCNPM